MNRYLEALLWIIAASWLGARLVEFIAMVLVIA